MSARPAAELNGRSTGAWRWIDDGLLPYALALMRATWVWLLIHVWSVMLQPERGDMLSPLLIAGLLLGGTMAAQVAVQLTALLAGRSGGWPEGSGRARPGAAAGAGAGLVVVVGGGLVGVALALYLAFGAGRYAPWDVRWLAALFSIPLATFFTVAIATWLWAWGVKAGRERLYYDTYARNFALGVGGLALAIALTYGTQMVPAALGVACALLFFALGLGTLAIASVQSTRQIERRRSEQSFRLSRYWLGMVAGVIGGLLVAGLLLAQLFTPDIIAHIVAALSWVLDLAAHVLMVLVLLITYPLFLLLDLIARLIGPLKPNGERPQAGQPGSLVDQLKDMQQTPAAMSPGLYLALRIIAGLLIAALVMIVFVLAYRRLQAFGESEEDVAETRELILSAGLLKAQLAGLFGGRRTGGVRPFVAVVGDDPVAQVRRTYQALLGWAAAQGLPRRPGVTPAEYSAMLGSAWPAAGEAIEALTRVYLEARYGGGPLTVAGAQRAAAAWQVIERKGTGAPPSTNGGNE